MKVRIFVSSVQKELAEERRAIRDFVRNDPLLRRFFDVWLFEDIPASDRRADQVYLQQVDRCAVYIGIFGNEYGAEDADGLSPTEHEFDQATIKGKPRLIFVKGTDAKARHPKMAALIKKAGTQLVRKRFVTLPDLTAAVHASLVDYLDQHGIIQERPFEEQPRHGATIADIDSAAVEQFVRRARAERQFPLAEKARVADVLTHLHLLADGKATNAALLLFGRDPQQFIPCAEIRCMHFHGTEIQRPVPFYRVFKGNLFEQVDHAVDFVLSKVNRSVGTRAQGPEAPVRLELPEDVVAEAIVNAVVHRDYASSAAVQVSVFADRVEVWNPGELQPPLTPEGLRKPHRSILRNHHVAETMFLAHYIEKYGTGTLMMIRESVKHALPEPRFDIQHQGEFGITIWRDWLTEEEMSKLGLNQRQMRALGLMRQSGKMTNAEFQKQFAVRKRTASQDLGSLVSLGLIKRFGTTGKGVFYHLIKGAPKGHKGHDAAKGVSKGNKGHDLGKRKQQHARAGKDGLPVPVKTSVKLLAALKGNAQLSIPDLASKIGVTTRSIERNIQTLQKQGRLRRVGPDKGGHWEVLG